MRIPLLAGLAVLCLLGRAGAGTHYPVEPWTPPELGLWLDADLSPAMGADDLMTLRYATGRLEDAVLAPQWWRETRFWARVGGFGYRAVRLLMLDYPQQYYATVWQHEFFGHGNRGREEGFPRIRYDIATPPPYGPGGGATHYTFPDGYRGTWDLTLARSSAGEEAEGVMADRMRTLWVRAGTQDSHGALMYLLARSSLREYLDLSDENSVGTDGGLSNDMLAYLYFLNGKEAGTAEVSGWKLHVRDLEEQERWSLIDPFYWYALGGLLYAHLWKGQAYWGYPAIPLGPVRYLPAVGYGLGPWGPEYRIENLFGWNGRAVIAGYRFGDATFRRSWGWDVSSDGLLRAAGCVLDAEAHYWMQPRLFLGSVAGGKAPRRAGYGGTLDVQSPILPVGIPLRVAGAAGWKTSGWVRGQDLRESVYWRVGIAWTPDIPVRAPADG